MENNEKLLGNFKVVRVEQWGEGYMTHTIRATLDDGSQFIGELENWFSYPLGEKVSNLSARNLHDQVYTIKNLKVEPAEPIEDNKFRRFKRIMDTKPCVQDIYRPVEGK